jgi:hypothetical protein
MKVSALYKKEAVLTFCLLMVGFVALAKEITIPLNFPQQSTAVSAVKSLPAAEEVSGNVIIDITPYPSTIEKGEYQIEYFLDSELVFQTSAVNSDSSGNLSFRCIIDTSRFSAGKHKLIVNLWKDSKLYAIGVREIIITNGNE